MSLIQERERKQLDGILKSMTNEVTMATFTQEFECNYCKMTRELLGELAALSDRLKLQIYDFVKESEAAKKYNIDKIPATLILGDRDYGIRFYGVPAGYEFTTLVEDIIAVSSNDPGIPEGIGAELSKIDKPVHIQVMVSPT
jgi:glutaredoxin-like protein